MKPNAQPVDMLNSSRNFVDAGSEVLAGAGYGRRQKPCAPKRSELPVARAYNLQTISDRPMPNVAKAKRSTVLTFPKLRKNASKDDPFIRRLSQLA